MQRDGDGDAIGRGGDADLIVGCRHLDGQADDLPWRGQPLHRPATARTAAAAASAATGTLSAAPPRRSGLREDPQIARQPSVERVHALRGPAAPRRSAAGPRSRPGGRRGPARAACRRRHRHGKLDDRIGRGALEACGPRLRLAARLFRLRASAPAPPRIRCAWSGRTVADQPLPDRRQRGAADLARPTAEHCLRPETVPADGTTAAPDRRCAAARPPRSVPRTILRNCSSTKVATAVSSPRSIARSNSRISNACDCGGSCAR